MKPSTDTLVIDAGTGNLHSVLNALQSQGLSVGLTSDPEEVIGASRLVLPGVGAFGSFMQGLRQRHLDLALDEVIRRGTPLLGICVGMQALLDVGKEMGEFKGLGYVEGEVIRFPDNLNIKVPHNGWNQIHFEKPCALFNGLPDLTYVYFTHSYYCSVAQKTDWAASTLYGINFACAVQKDNILGVQFHPEKSQKVGQQILANFIKI
ncbi:MAG: imidazole glycerol phosphate synthase subunit HisH [Anaerolineae bacterium]|nr:imidazole glycerol phosphate synthase subunit HisH [Anaerolineae bacterium]